jgi:uncharacterized protein (DUF2147 family)
VSGKIVRWALPIILLVVFTFGAFAISASEVDDEADAMLGEWLTDAKGSEMAQVYVYREGDQYYGRITWLEYPEFRDDDEQGMAGAVKVDRENPDPDLRNRPVLGMVILKEFEYRGAWKWKGGTIYDPENGKTYRGSIRLTSGGTLKMRGYVGIPLFGRTTVWTRVGEEPGNQ